MTAYQFADLEEITAICVLFLKNVTAEKQHVRKLIYKQTTNELRVSN